MMPLVAHASALLLFERFFHFERRAPGPLHALQLPEPVLPPYERPNVRQRLRLELQRGFVPVHFVDPRQQPARPMHVMLLIQQ